MLDDAMDSPLVTLIPELAFARADLVFIFLTWSGSSHGLTVLTSFSSTASEASS
jgi:hypothetical protein